MCARPVSQGQSGSTVSWSRNKPLTNGQKGGGDRKDGERNGPKACGQNEIKGWKIRGIRGVWGIGARIEQTRTMAP